MQKKVMAIAVAGALAVPATAFAAASSLQISGRATFEYGVTEQGANRPDTDLLNAPGGSHIRVKGMEKLGGGMSAWFQCESSIDVTGRSTGGDDGHHFCTRNSAVGFKGSFGNFWADRWDTPFKRAINAGKVGSYSTGLLGTSNTLFGTSTTTSISGRGDKSPSRHVWSRREVGTINYETPNFSGLKIRGAVTSASATRALNTSMNQKPRLWSIGATFDNGPIEAGLGYEKHNDVGTFGDRDMDDRAWGASFAYTFGKVQVGVTYLDAEYDTTVPGTESGKKTYSIGADWRLPGPHMLSFQYAKAKDTTGNGSEDIGNVTACGNVATNCADTGGDTISLGYTYRFSKRTKARLGWLRHDSEARTNEYSGGRVRANGDYPNGSKIDVYAVHVQHNF